MAVRLDKDLRATIDKVVASYNRKIRYYEKQGIEGLPPKTSFQEIIDLGSRKSIMRELNALTKLNRKSIDRVVLNGNLTTTYEKEYIEGEIKRAKRLLKSRIKKLSSMELKQYGKGAGFTMGDRFAMTNLTGAMKNGRIRSDKLIANLRKYERVSDTSSSDYIDMSPNEKRSFKNLLNRIFNPYINKKLKDSYLEAFSDLGYAYGYDSKKMAEIEKKLKKLSNEEFEKLFTEDVAVKKIFDYYSIMKINLGANTLENQEAVFDLYDNLYDNLDEMIGSLQNE